MRDERSVSDSLRSHQTSQFVRVKLGATFCKWLAWSVKGAIDFSFLSARSWEHDHWIAKNFELQGGQEKGHKGPHRGPKSSFHVALHNGVQYSFFFKKHWKSQQPKLRWTEISVTGKTKNVSPCGMVSYTTTLLVDRTPPQLRTPQVRHDSSATIKSEIMLISVHHLVGNDSRRDVVRIIVGIFHNKRHHFLQFFLTEMVVGLVTDVMEMNPLRCIFCTITDVVFWVSSQA